MDKGAEEQEQQEEERGSAEPLASSANSWTVCGGWGNWFVGGGDGDDGRACCRLQHTSFAKKMTN